ncbi:hypothetical protein FRC01_008485, partial [Tulasnella sp. 417]
VSLGKAFEPGYQQWPIIHSRQIVIRGAWSTTMGATRFQRLYSRKDPRALRYVNQALILLMTMFQDMIRCAANQSPQGIDYRRVRPRRSVPDTTWLNTSPKSFLPWIGLGQPWWELDNSPMVLEGYNAYRLWGNVNLQLNSMTMTLSRGQNPDEVRGTGQDGMGPFNVNGTVDGAVVTLHKRYPGQSWKYRGILLPWALVGVWQGPGGIGTPDGDFCLWLVE